MLHFTMGFAGDALIVWSCGLFAVIGVLVHWAVFLGRRVSFDDLLAKKFVSDQKRTFSTNKLVVGQTS